MKKITETNNEKLKKRSWLNVQEQLIVKRDAILNEAKYWRQKGIPLPLEIVFKENGINIKECILLDYEQNFPGSSTDEGIVLTSKGHFYEFEADLNFDKSELIELYSFIDVTKKYEISAHKKGIGKTYGFLAIEVLQELNRELI